MENRPAQPSPGSLAQRDRCVAAFLRKASVSPEIQFALRTAASLQEILAITARAGCPLHKSDFVLTYRDLNQPYFPWHGHPKQKRREFIHMGAFIDQQTG
jgi:hypothetical protein